MKKIKLLTAIAVSTIPLPLVATSCGQSKEEKVYRDINFNEGWTFRLNDDTQEQTINLPHDFSIIQKFKYSNRELRKRQSSGTTGFLPGGVGYYHKDFVLPKKDNATVILNFDGSYNDTTVAVNGQIVGNNQYGYNPFAFDISNYVVADGKTVNTLDVTVRHEFVTSSRWYPGSGIYRDVKLSVLDKIHVAHNGTYVTTPNLENEVGSDATVNVEVDVQNSYDESKKVHVQNRIVDANGDAVCDWTNSDSQNIKANNTGTLSTTLKVNNPKLWSAEDPNLYYVETRVVNGNNIVDQYKTRFGFRYYSFDTEGFKVNGKRTKIHGVCLHHDQGALGAAAYNDAIYRQLSIMKEMGVNAVRTSHNCPDEDFLRICDELGLYVMDEAFDGWEFAKTQSDFSLMWKEHIGFGNQLIDATPDMQWHSFVMRSMVKRDRNCPSIFLWSLGNELHEGPWHDAKTTDAEKQEIENEMLGFAQEMNDIAHELDHDPKTKRWCTIALEYSPNKGSAYYDWPKCKIGRMLYDEGGLLGLNYPLTNDLEESLNEFDQVFGSETASANNSRGMYATYDDDGNEEHFRVTSYDNAGRMMASEVLWQTLNYDGYGGQFVWTGFDYIGEPSPWCWNCEDDDPSVVEEHWPYPNSAYYGIVDTCGFPKDSYYLYRSHLRQDDTTLHLVGSLNEKNMYINEVLGSPLPWGYTPIDIYTNAPYVVIKNGETPIAEVTQTPVDTSQGLGQYYTYEATAIDTEICSANETQAKKAQRHGMYSSIWVNPVNITNITAEAYDKKGGNLISQTVGLKELKHIDTTEEYHIECNAERKTMPADGKSLSYITVDLKDKNGTLITDWDSRVELKVSWSGAGQVLGVDNGHPADDEKFQNPEYFHKTDKTARVWTFAGKAVIIVCSDNTPGDINVKIGNESLGYQIVPIKAE